jgi:hypothetical protein
VEGAQAVLALPGLAFAGGAGDPPRVPAPSGQWTPPSGEVVAIAPDEIQEYRTDVVTPAFASPEVWRDPRALATYWTGTDPAQETSETHALFVAGLLFGVAGSAVVGAVQEFAFRRRRARRS